MKVTPVPTLTAGTYANTAITKAAEAAASAVAAAASAQAAAGSLAAVDIAVANAINPAVIAAEAAASAAAGDAIATAADRVQTGLDVIATAADRVQTGFDVVATGADVIATAADVVSTGLDAVATAGDRVQTGLDVIATAADVATTAALVIALTAVDGHASATLTAEQVTASEIHNIGQVAASDLALPAAAVGMHFLMVVGEATAFAWRIRAAATDKLYINGVAGADNGYFGIATPTVGSYITAFTFKTGASSYDWNVIVGLGNWGII